MSNEVDLGMNPLRSWQPGSCFCISKLNHPFLRQVSWHFQGLQTSHGITNIKNFQIAHLMSPMRGGWVSRNNAKKFQRSNIWSILEWCIYVSCLDILVIWWNSWKFALWWFGQIHTSKVFGSPGSCRCPKSDTRVGRHTLWSLAGHSCENTKNGPKFKVIYAWKLLYHKFHLISYIYIIIYDYFLFNPQQTHNYQKGPVNS